MANAADQLKKIVAIASGTHEEPEVVCLACTELPLAFPERSKFAKFHEDGTLYLNSSAIHIDALFTNSLRT